MAKGSKLESDDFIFRPKRHRLAKLDTKTTRPFKTKEEAEGTLARDIERLAKLQDILYAQNTYALLAIFQAMDAAGKDGTIKHVMSGVNPQGCQVFSFKAPSAEELDHDYLWRSSRCLPERGRIGIFNRSYYEEVLVVRVHRVILESQQLPNEAKGSHTFKDRYRHINDFERYLVENGIIVMKFFLNVSKGEQKRRFLARLDDPEKNWKFSPADVRERGHWDDYQRVYDDMLEATSTKLAPWHVVPADNKWFTRAVVARAMVEKLESLGLKYPTVTKEQKAGLAEARKILMAE